MSKLKQILSNPDLLAILIGAGIFYGSLAVLIWSAGWIAGLAVFLMICANNGGLVRG